MAQPRRRRPPTPRRIVHYKVSGDALGPFIAFGMDIVMTPGDVPPHKLPEGAQLYWGHFACRFTPGDSNITQRQLHTLFLEFAETMNWEVHRDP